LFGFLLKPPRVIRGRAAGDAAAQVSKLQLQFGARQRGVNLLVQFVDDLRRRFLGCADTYPCSRIVTRHKLSQRWDVRQDLRARRSGDRQCAHFAGLDVLNGRITFAHFSLSSTTSFPKSAGEPGTTVPPRSASRAFTLGSARAALTSLLSLSTISAGVFLGAKRPNHPLAS